MRFRDTAVLADRATGNASLLAISRHEPTFEATARQIEGLLNPPRGATASTAR
jgi:hypothetical protein